VAFRVRWLPTAISDLAEATDAVLAGSTLAADRFVDVDEKSGIPKSAKPGIEITHK
jgi:hypothetical protein